MMRSQTEIKSAETDVERHVGEVCPAHRGPFTTQIMKSDRCRKANYLPEAAGIHYVERQDRIRSFLKPHIERSNTASLSESSLDSIVEQTLLRPDHRSPSDVNPLSGRHRARRRVEQCPGTRQSAVTQLCL
jgi:hypothetical protein